MLCLFVASLLAYVGTACMFTKMLSTVLFARQNPIYAVVYVLACFCKWCVYSASCNLTRVPTLLFGAFLSRLICIISSETVELWWHVVFIQAYSMWQSVIMAETDAASPPLPIVYFSRCFWFIIYGVPCALVECTSLQNPDVLKNTSRFFFLKDCLKASTIILLSILSKSKVSFNRMKSATKFLWEKTSSGKLVVRSFPYLTVHSCCELGGNTNPSTSNVASVTQPLDEALNCRYFGL